MFQNFDWVRFHTQISQKHGYQSKSTIKRILAKTLFEIYVFNLSVRIMLKSLEMF